MTELQHLPNRDELERRLARALAGQASNSSRHCLVHLYLNGFADISAQAGRASAAAFLQQVVDIIVSRLRARDTLARLDEGSFGLLLEHCPLDRGRQLLWALTTAVANHRLIEADREYQTLLSAGLIATTPGENNITRLLSHAEIACHIAREHLGGGVYIYQDDPTSTEQIHNWLSHTPPTGECQPLIPFRDGQQPWQRLRVVQPSTQADQTDSWLLERLRSSENLPSESLLIPLSVGSLADPGVRRDLLTLPPQSGPMFVELPWAHLEDEANLSRQTLRECRDHGIRVIASGFPGSIASFAQLRQWPLHGVIIGLEPLPSWPDRPESQLYVQGLVAALHAVDLTVILDGLDHPQAPTEAQALAVELGGGSAVAAAKNFSDVGL